MARLPSTPKKGVLLVSRGPNGVAVCGCRFPNGCAHGSDRDAVRWDIEKLRDEAADEWVMWHAACIKGLPQKLSSLTGLSSVLRPS